MRKQVRGAEPACLARNAARWSASYQPGDPPPWSEHCYQQIRTALFAITGGRCAYCDGRCGAQSRKTVDHFQPKQLFPKRVAEWGNLFGCCDACQSAKSSRYDPNLLRPDASDFAFVRFFRCNFAKGSVEPCAAEGTPEYFAAQTTISLLGLNRLDLCEARLRELEHFAMYTSPTIDHFDYRDFIEASL